MTSVIIPDSVTNIADRAFENCSSLTNVTIGNGVTGVGSQTFDGCSSLASVTIGSSVASIGASAFGGCASLASVTIPGSVTNIGGEVFSGCTSLSMITVVSTNSFYSSANGVLFDKNQTTLLAFPGGLGGSYAIPSTVTSIADNAFFSCQGPTSITIPDSVTNIGQSAFAGCGLTEVRIPNGVTVIADNAFSSCSSLTNVAIPDNVTSIGSQAFWSCPSLVSITIPDSVTSIGVEAFQFCRGLRNITIGNSVTNIGGWAFYNCPTLAEAYFQGNAPTADSTVFGYDRTTAFYLPGTTGWSGFTSSTGAPAVLWNPLTQSGDYYYTNNGGVITITGYFGTGGTVIIPAAINSLPVTSLGPSAFAGSSVTNITIPGAVTNIGDSAFGGCFGLTSAAFPKGLLTIGPNAFSSTRLTSIEIPDSVSSIGDNAFSATYPTNVTISENVTNIGNGAFSFCGYLAAITVDARNSWYRSVNGVLFDKSLTTILEYPGGLFGSYGIPGSVTSIAADAFQFCNGLTWVTDPGSVTNIADSAFSYCSSLTGIYFQGNAPDTDPHVFEYSNQAILYYQPGATGWGSIFVDAQAVLWNPVIQAGGANFDVLNNQFSFDVIDTNNTVFVVEATTSLANPVWSPLQTITLTNGSFHFSEPVQKNSPARFYRLSPP